MLQVARGSWFEPLEHLRSSLAGVLCNPPYIPSADIPLLQVTFSLICHFLGPHSPKILCVGPCNYRSSAMMRWQSSLVLQQPSSRGPPCCAAPGMSCRPAWCRRHYPLTVSVAVQEEVSRHEPVSALMEVPAQG